MKVKTIIIGAGIAGLAAAHRLQKAGEAFLLLESETRAGGKIGTASVDGHLLEQGPNSFLSSGTRLMALLDELGLQEQIVSASDAAKKRYILLGGRLVPLPRSRWELLLSALLGPAAKLQIFLEPLLARRGKDPEESFERFVTRHFGRQIASRIAEPFVSGIFAGDPAKLSVAAAFPALYRLEQEHRSLLLAMKHTARRARLCSLRDGLGVLPDALADRLQAQIRLGAGAQSVTRRFDHFLVTTGDHAYDCDQVILATPVDTAARLLREISPEAARLMEEIKSVPMKVIHTSHRKEDMRHPLDGFGYLVPRDQKVRHLGTLFSDSSFPDRSPEGEVLLTTFVGGAFDRNLLDAEDDQLTGEIGREHEVAGLYQGEPAYTSVTTWPRAVPQYDTGHLKRISDIRQALSEAAGLHLAGNYLRGVSISACVESADEAVDAVLNRTLSDDQGAVS